MGEVWTGNVEGSWQGVRRQCRRGKWVRFKQAMKVAYLSAHGEELEDGEHAAGADVVAVDEALRQEVSHRETSVRDSRPVFPHRLSPAFHVLVMDHRQSRNKDDVPVRRRWGPTCA